MYGEGAGSLDSLNGVMAGELNELKLIAVEFEQGFFVE